ncbi:MAG: retron St85 family RNA-directed DNA polymerase [Reyranella sp.]|jgi:hypothetical protein|nr:retron St85 family RNA-directed DNA polymerase [Reyranella sp.]
MTIGLLKELGIKLGMGRSDLLRIISTAPKRYKVYQIPKRRGGTRTIAQPSRELKAIQRVLLKAVLSKFPVHAAATGYVENRSILDNAVAHMSSRVLLKLDFRDFFPSIVPDDWRRLARAKFVDLDEDEVWLSTMILFWGQKSTTPRCLSIGAPTSPMLSNIVMYSLDVRLAEAAAATNTTYTRYADDITASGPTIEDVRQFEAYAREIVGRSVSPQLTFNDQKRGIYSSGQRRMVTGLVLTPSNSVSIGRERKRLISSMLDHWIKDSLDNERKARLKGLLAFCIAAEPAFVSRLRAKYGDGPVNDVLRYHIVRKGPPPRQAGKSSS